MTIKEFDAASWGANMICDYHGETRKISRVDFLEKLIYMENEEDEEDEDVARCENVANVRFQRS